MTQSPTTHATPTTRATPAILAPSVRRGASGGVAACLVLAGALFVIYPALRPYSTEVGYDGARAFASWQWTAAHLCGMAAFVLLAHSVGRLGLAPIGLGRIGPVATALGATLVLPYYGAEVFGVGAVGRRALAVGDPGLVGMVDDIRYGVPAVVVFALGLGLLAVGGVALGVTLWRAGGRAAGVLLLVGLTAYLPQFYLAPGLRVVHGIVLGLGLLLVARHARSTPPAAGTTPA